MYDPMKVHKFHDVDFELRILSQNLIGCGLREGSGGESNTLVGSVEDGVETLEECVPIDEVEALPGLPTDVADDEVDVV